MVAPLTGRAARRLAEEASPGAAIDVGSEVAGCGERAAADQHREPVGAVHAAVPQRLDEPVVRRVVAAAVHAEVDDDLPDTLAGCEPDELLRHSPGVGRLVVRDVQGPTAVDHGDPVGNVAEPDEERRAPRLLPPAVEEGRCVLRVRDRREGSLHAAAAAQLELPHRRDPQAVQHLGGDHEVGEVVQEAPLVVARDERPDASLHLRHRQAADRHDTGADEGGLLGPDHVHSLGEAPQPQRVGVQAAVVRRDEREQAAVAVPLAEHVHEAHDADDRLAPRQPGAARGEIVGGAVEVLARDGVVRVGVALLELRDEVADVRRGVRGRA